MALDYFYHGQFRQYIVQMIRAFSGFQHCTEFQADNITPVLNPDGSIKSLKTVPVRMASQDKMVASILSNNSSNTMLSVPSISVYMTNVAMSAERRQMPNFVDTLSVHEREIDTVANRYTQERGKSYTVERFMPVPYELTFQVDIWTSNFQQKCEIMEQLLVLFNPGMDLQTSTNPLDWTALTTVELQDITWTSRGIPIGSGDDIEVASLTFRIPAWINPPGKVQRYRIIEQIITQITQLDKDQIESNGDIDSAAQNWSSQGDIFARMITTPGDHIIEVNGNSIRLVTTDVLPTNNLGESWNWINLFELYGKYRPGISQIRLKTNDNMDDHETDVVGNIEIDPLDPTILSINFDPTTLPVNNLPAIDAIIDPRKSWYTPVGDPPCPNPFPTALPDVGVRYMILNDIAENTTWGTLGAHANDIIEYGSDGQWHVVFDSAAMNSFYTLVNTKTGKQLTWAKNHWVITLAGEYTPGMWRIAL